jgi:cell surface protein SprA
VRGSDLEDGTSLGNTIANNRTLNINGSFNMERLYNHIPFLKKANDRFNRTTSYAKPKRVVNTRKTASDRKKEKPAEDAKKKALPMNKRSYEKEITLLPDTTIMVSHGKHTRRLVVAGKTAEGKSVKIKYRKISDNQLRITNKVDSAMKVKITVTPKEPLEQKSWYKTAQSIARVLMMVRNVSVSYRSQYAMALPGFMPMAGDAFGQKRSPSAFAPGLDFAFGMIGDSYVEKANERGWLLKNNSVATPATTNKTEDLQLRMTLEPIKELKIDLNASRTWTKAKSIQYMYAGNPTTQSGTFTMTTISIKSALEGIGSASDGYHSRSFEKFCRSLDGFRDKVEARYAGAVYPEGTVLAGQKYDVANGGVNKYSADVMIPAFLANYTLGSSSSLSLFPTLSRMLPNWSVRYSGLSRLPWFRDVFKSINLNHAYKSIFAIGSYASYSTYQEYMNGLGFISDATTGNPVPSSMFNVSAVSINEAFSPLLGVDMTFDNNMTAKVEYRTTRVLNLSMTSVQINEALSRDWVIGMGYRINDFKPFGWGRVRKAKSRKKSSEAKSASSSSENNRSGINNSLNMRLDLSFRKQASITRDIASVTSSASSGNTAFKLSFMADYTLSRMLTMSFYYDRQTNTPLLSSSSYPTTTSDFGLSVKFSLTR